MMSPFGMLRSSRPRYERQLTKRRHVAVLVSGLAVLLLATSSYAQEPLTVTITDCYSGADGVVFTNNTGDTDISIRLVTSALRGMGANTYCPNVSYWEKRYPSVTKVGEDFVLQGSLTVFTDPNDNEPQNLSTYLPDHFPTVKTWAAANCDHYILSLSVQYTDTNGDPFLDPNDVPYPPATASCKNSSFPYPTIPGEAESDQVARDVVIASLVAPSSLGFGDPGECANGDTSETMLQNLSLDSAYQGVWAGRYVCMTKDTDLLIDPSPPLGPEVCSSGAPTGPKTGRGINGKSRGFRVTADDCAGMRVNPGGGFPECCDCDTLTCASPVVVQCVRGTVMGKMGPGDSEFSYYDPFIFLDPTLDLEPRTEYDVDSNPLIKPNRKSIAISCNEFSFSDIDGFSSAVYNPFNPATDRYDFDFDDPDNPETDNCKDRSSGVIGGIRDADANGTADSCQAIDIVEHDFSRGRDVSVRRRVRNLFYDGSASTTETPGAPEGPPAFDTFSTVLFGGQEVDLTGAAILTGETYGRYEEVLQFDSPGGLEAMGPGQKLVFDPTTPNEETVDITAYSAADLLLAGSHDALTSTVSGFDLFDVQMGEPANADLLVAERDSSPTVATPVRGLGANPYGGVVYVSAGTEIFVYDTDCRTAAPLEPDSLLGECPHPEYGQELGTEWVYITVDGYGVAVEPDDGYVYVLSGNSDTTPGMGWFSVVQRADHHLFISPGGDSMFGSITGTPIDLEVVNVDDGGGREAFAYVTSQVLAGASCSGGGGGGGGGGPIVPLGASSAWHRRILISAHALDRPTFSGASQIGDVIEFSCLDILEPALEPDIGLDMDSNGRIFVVSPDQSELKVIELDAATNGLDESSMQSITLGFRPADVVVGQGPVNEVAIVVGRDETVGEGRILLFRDTANLNDVVDVDATGSMDFVAVALRDDGRTGYIADEGKSEIWILNVAAGSIEPQKLPASETLRRLEIQRTDP